MPTYEPTVDATTDQPAATGPRPLHELLVLARTEPPPCLAGSVDRVMVVCAVTGIILDAHAQGRFHGDLRPANILVQGHGGVTIIGWNGSAPDRHPAHAYRAPELRDGDAPTAAGDIYAIGAILWELLTLRPALVVEENLTRFHRRKNAGEVDPLPQATHASVPAELLAMARRAMNPDPALRWHGPEEILTALHGWLRRLESVAITLQAESTLVESIAGNRDAAQPAGAYRSALALWPGNQAAQDGLAATETAQAISAIRNGDESRAEAHLAHASGAAHAAVTAEFRRLKDSRRRSRRGRLALLACLVALLAAGVWFWRFHQPRTETWATETEWVLTRGARTAGLEATYRDINGHDAVATPAKDGLTLPVGHIIWLKDIDGRGDIRLSIDAEWNRQVDGLELMIAAPRVLPPSFFMTQPGYSCQFGGFRGTQTFLSSSAEAGWPLRPAPIAFPFTAGRRYNLAMERQGEHLRLRVDGTVVWDQREVVPVGDSRFRWLALRAWTQVTVHRIQVEKPLEQPPINALSTADALASAGHHADALAAYLGALRSDPGPQLRAQAIAKAHLVASRLPARNDERRALMQMAERDLPETSPYLLDVLQAEAASLWRSREWQPALALAARIQQRHPGERCALALLGRRIDGVPETVLQSLLQLIASGPPVSHLTLAGLGLADLSPLHGMRLESLDISGNRIADLGPLAGMPLRRLLCTDNLITSLQPLAGMPLVVLDAADNRIADLGPLAGMPLEQLLLDGNRVTDLRPLAGLPLDRLLLQRNPVADVAPLSSCARLEYLRISDSQVSDLSRLPFGPLRSLSITRSPLRDISPLAGSSIYELNLSDTAVEDVGALPRQTLRALTMANTPLADLRSLAGLRLGVLDLSGTRLTSLDGFAALSVDPDGMLTLDRTAITSLAPLSAPTLLRLSIRDTRVADLAPLGGGAIKNLLADGVPATDLEPIGRIAELQRLSLWKTGASPAAMDLLADGMERNRLPALLVETLRIHAAVQAQDWRRLRAMARRMGAYDRLPLQIDLTHAAATAVAAAAGARLPCPIDPADLVALASSPPIGGWFWVGLQPHTDTTIIPRWENGRLDQHLSLMIKPQPDPYAGAAWSCPTPPNQALLHPISRDRLATSMNQVVLEW